MTVTNSIENRVRTVSFDVEADTGPFQLDFPLYEAASLSALKSDLVVKLNGVRITAYTITATFVDGVATDGQLTLDEAATGNLEVYSRRAPRSAWSFIDGARTKAARWTTTFNSLTASVRDVFDETDRQAAIIDGLQSGIADRLVVGTIEALRTTPEDYDGTVVEVLGWHADTLVGGGLFALDPDDATSPDDWGTVIVDEQGRRWKRLHANRLGEADFGVIADGSTDDSDYVEKALQWLTACPAHERRTIWADAGARVITRALTLNTVENHARAQWLAAAGQSATYSCETADDAIVIEIDGGRAIVVVDGPSPIPGMEGCGSLLVARNIGGGAGVPNTGLFIKNIDATPKNQQTSTFYSLKPFDFTGTKRCHIRKVDCRPGKLAPVVYGDCIMDVSNCYAFDIDECTLGGYFDFGIKAAHTENVEGGRIGENVRITNCKWGFSWESETPQPGLNISKMHVNSSTYGNIKLDGVTNYTIDGPLLYSNETRKYTWVKPANQSIVGITQANPAVVNYAGADSYTNGDTIYITGVVGMTEVNSLGFTIANVNTAANTFELQGVNSSGYGAYVSGGTIAATTLTVTCDGGNTPHRLTSPFRVRAGFNVADVDDPELDLDNDGESDAPPSGTYTATVLTDYTFTISDDGFAALADTGTFKMRWSDSDFDDIVIRNGVNGVVKNVRFGGQASRNRRHIVLDTTDSVAVSPTLQGNHVIDNLMSARSNLAPIYVGASKDTVVRHAANWAEDLGRVHYPDDVDPVQRAATGVERLLVVDGADSFEERAEGGIVSALKNGKFARGSKFWDAGTGWSVDTAAADALTYRAKAIYTAPDTSNNNLISNIAIPVEPGSSLRVEWLFKVASGAVTQHRVRANFYDAAGAVVGSTLFGSTDTGTPADWTRRSHTFTVPATAVDAFVGLQVAMSAGGIMNVDRIVSLPALTLGIPDGTWGEVAVSGGGTVWKPAFEYEDIAALAAASVPVVVTRAYTRFRAAANKTGGAWYKRVGSEPAHDMKLQDAAGAWWEFDETAIDIRQAGALVNDSADDTAAILRAIAYVKALGGGEVLFPRGTTCISATLDIDQGHVHLVGMGEAAYRATQSQIPGAALSRIKWIGAAGGRMVKFESPEGGFRQNGGGMRRLMVDGNAFLADTGLEIRTWQYGRWEDLYVYACNVDHILTGVTSRTLIQTPYDTQNNLFLRCRVSTRGSGVYASSTATGWRLTGNLLVGGGANTSINQFIHCHALMSLGQPWKLENCDTNTFISCGGGAQFDDTVYGFELGSGDQDSTGNGVPSRYNMIQHTQAEIHVRAGQTGNASSTGNYIVINRGNVSQLPTFETPAGGSSDPTATVIDIDGTILLAGKQVLGPRVDGWEIPIGPASRTTFDTTTVTLAALAEKVKALIADVSTMKAASHGLIGTVQAAATADADIAAGEEKDVLAISFFDNTLRIRDTVTPANNYSGTATGKLTVTGTLTSGVNGAFFDASNFATLPLTAMPWSATGGSLMVEFYDDAIVSAANATLVSIDNGASGERIVVRAISTTGDKPHFVGIDGGVSQWSIQAANWPDYVNGETKRIAVSWTANDAAACYDGGTVGLDVTSTLPTPTTLRLGVNHFGAEAGNCRIKRMVYTPRVLSDAELQVWSLAWP